MSTHALSSGDLTADRRADYARMLGEGGDPGAAAELMEQALDLVPGWAAGWFRLGEYRQKAGLAGAADAYRRALECDAQDIFGAGLKLALLGEAEIPSQPSSRYVERLFDDYADRFETALVERLDYVVPQALAAMIAATGRQFRLGVDLGCGTGLLGPEIRDRVTRLEGFDLSRNMLAKAAEKQVYDHLAQADLSLAPEGSGLFEGAAMHRADLITAADVLMYLGDLENAFVLIAALAAPDAILAFSVEDSGEPDSFVLRDSMRYAHGEAYVAALCAIHGFTVAATQKTAIRKDGGKAIMGILFVAARTT
ncbi:MAG: methyltransferase [Rhizobiales bacterium 63-7]|nr:methyltransferase domain-containing protein [Hyphomicrobiales bacterium]OJU69376.1 MAG: methyltransferase [Rhizobiales bacterium 63-7]